MYKRHYIKLIAFFSSIILLCMFVGIAFSLKGLKEQSKVAISQIAPIPSDVLHNQAIIQQASVSGTILCTDEDPSVCDRTQEGKVLEYNVGCNGTTPSGSQYICKNGRWQYIVWTQHGYCSSFCKKK